jgi:hypothetical protein
MTQETTPTPSEPHDKQKALASLATAAVLATGVNVSPDNAQLIGTIAAIAIPFLPSAYQGIASIISSVYSRRANRKK